MSRTGFWIDTVKTIHQSTKDAPFCLINTKDTKLFSTSAGVEIVDWTEAARIDLDTVYNHYEANKVYILKLMLE